MRSVGNGRCARVLVPLLASLRSLALVSANVTLAPFQSDHYCAATGVAAGAHGISQTWTSPRLSTYAVASAGATPKSHTCDCNDGDIAPCVALSAPKTGPGGGVFWIACMHFETGYLCCETTSWLLQLEDKDRTVLTCASKG